MNEKGSDTVSIFSPILTQILSSAEIASSKVKKILNDGMLFISKI